MLIAGRGARERGDRRLEVRKHSNIGGPVKPATVVKVLPPLIGRGVPRSTEGYYGWIGSGSHGFPKSRPIPEATIGLTKKDHTNSL